jgi:trans-2,3-dihydro-3-hydroxyanthranilate isomerase
VSRRYRFRQVDVFTDRPFHGNPLAVFPEAEGLSDAEMQMIAREMNLSETSFVVAPTPAGAAEDATYRMRIFMPRRELPFAGHPSLGTAWVLADDRRFPLESPFTEVRQEVGIGVLPLRIAVSGDTVGDVMMTQGVARILGGLSPADLNALAAALGVTTDAFGWTDPSGESHDVTLVPPRVASTGLTFLVVPFRDRAVLRGVASTAGAAAAALVRAVGADGLALVAPGSDGAVARADVHVRMLDDLATSGISEDPATGSAAGPIAVYLGHLAGARAETREIVIEQGVEIGRPSRLVAQVDFDANEMPREVRVGGSIVPLIEGWLELP